MLKLACYGCLMVCLMLLLRENPQGASDDDTYTYRRSPGQNKGRSSPSRSRSSSTAFLKSSRWQPFPVGEIGNPPSVSWEELFAEAAEDSDEASGMACSLDRIFIRSEFGRRVKRARHRMPENVRVFAWSNFRPVGTKRKTKVQKTKSPTLTFSSAKVVFTNVQVGIDSAYLTPVYQKAFCITIDYAMTKLNSRVYVGYELQVAGKSVEKFEPTPLTTDPKAKTRSAEVSKTALQNPMWRRLQCLGFKPDSFPAAGTDGGIRTLWFLTDSLQADMTPWASLGLNSLELGVYEQGKDGQCVFVGGLKLVLKMR